MDPFLRPGVTWPFLGIYGWASIPTIYLAHPPQNITFAAPSVSPGFELAYPSFPLLFSVNVPSHLSLGFEGL